MFSQFPQPNILELRRDAILKEMGDLRRQIDSQSMIAREAFSNLRRELEERLPEELTAEVLPLLQHLFDLSSSSWSTLDSVLDLLQRRVQVTVKVLDVLDDVLKAYRQVHSTLDVLAAYRDFAADLRDVVCLRVEQALGKDGLTALGWKKVTLRRIEEERYAELQWGSPSLVYGTFKKTLGELGVTAAEFTDLNLFRKLAAGLFHKKQMAVSTAFNKIGNDQFPPELVRFKPAIKNCLAVLQKQSCAQDLAEVERIRRAMRD